MYVYFDANGTLKEIISEKSFRVGDSKKDKIYVYWEGEHSPISGWVKYKKPNGKDYPASIEECFYQIGDEMVGKELPIKPLRNLKYFSYNHTYQENGETHIGYKFYEITIPDAVLNSSLDDEEVPTENNMIVARIRFVMYDNKNGKVDEADSIETLGALVFSVETNIGILTDSSINETQYNYLIQLVSMKLGTNTKSVKVSQLPSTGVVGTIYYVEKEDNGIVYDAYFWNGTEFVFMGTTSYGLYTKQEGDEFEVAIQALWNAELNDYKALMNSNFENYKNLINDEMDSYGNLIQSAASGSPKGVYPTLTALQNAFPTGTNGIYVVSENGHWYYWNGSAWTDGGVYQSTAIAENNVSGKELDTDVANCIAGNRPLITRQGGYLSKSTGTYKDDAAYHSISSKMLDCKPGDVFYYKGFGVSDAGSVLFYNGPTLSSFAIYNSKNSYTRVVIPNGINKVIFSSLADNGTDVVFDLIKENISFDMLEQNVKNQLIVFTSQIGYLQYQSGAYYGTDSYHSISSVILDCKPGDIYYYKGIGNASTASVIFYNGTSIVSYLQIDSTNAYTPVIVPSGVNKVIFSSYAKIGEDVIFDVVKFNISKNFYCSNLAGKKYVACGDSFTRGGSLPNGSSYPYLVANTKNMSLTLLAVNGGFIHYDISKHPNACFTNTSGSVNYTQIPEDADYITIAYGLNELSTPIGDKTSSDNTTIWGAFNEVLGWIIANRPKAKVGIIANDSWFKYAMRNTLKEIAAYWGVGFLDLKEYGKTLLIGGKYAEDGEAISTTAVNARNAQYKVSNDDAHPNADGHKARATIIAEWLETL